MRRVEIGKEASWIGSKLDETERGTTNKKEVLSGKTQNKVVKPKLAQKYQIPACQKANERPKDGTKNRAISGTSGCKTPRLFSLGVKQRGGLCQQGVALALQ